MARDSHVPHLISGLSSTKPLGFHPEKFCTVWWWVAAVAFCKIFHFTQLTSQWLCERIPICLLCSKANSLPLTILHFQAGTLPFLKKSFLINQARGEAALIVPWMGETLCHMQIKTWWLTLIPPQLTSPANSTPIPIRKENINAEFIGHQAAYCGWNFPTSSVSLAVAKHLKEALHSPK